VDQIPAQPGPSTSQGGWMARFLTVIERVGNALPHPGTLFALMALLVILASWVTSWFHLEVIHPGTGQTISPVNLLSVAGLHQILTNMVTNFTSFAPLGTVLVAMLGIGIAEGSGLIAAALRLLVMSAPKRLLTFVIVFAGVLSNTASEIGYVLLVPLAASIFLAAGRHPIAGLAAAFAWPGLGRGPPPSWPGWPRRARREAIPGAHRPWLRRRTPPGGPGESSIPRPARCGPGRHGPPEPPG
jgi:p-aminobenzoyl-glutamate transporter AbgT